VVVIIEVGRCKVEDDDGEGLMEGGRWKRLFFFWYSFWCKGYFLLLLMFWLI
jgi:hypothetical protein